MDISLTSREVNEGRLIIVSNRLPVSLEKKGRGFTAKPSVGGLATGMSSVFTSRGGRWVGWPGLQTSPAARVQRQKITQVLAERHCRPVFMTQEEIDHFYHGFANDTIWPLFHYFPQYADYDELFWKHYVDVNQKFCEAVLELAQPGDTIWVHDYHLLLLPRMIREASPEVSIGFFLHIPFPAYEIFRALPWRREILEGLLGADLIGFHTYDYVRDFLDSIRRILGLDSHMGQIHIQNRMAKVDCFPMGIDYDRYHDGADLPEVVAEADDIRRELGDRQTILSIDRLDYSKGILHRLEAFDRFLGERRGEHHRVTLILLVVPSRTEVEKYAGLKRLIDQKVGQINGRYGSIGWVPIWYLYRSLPFEKLMALYRLADVAMVTPLRDGMNLVAKEYVAAQTNGDGALVLSEMAGSAKELGEAFIVNPNNIEHVAAMLEEALNMSYEDRNARIKAMQARLKRYNVSGWAEDFLNRLKQIKDIQRDFAIRRLTRQAGRRIVADYRAATNRLLMFDYDGTLAPFRDRPELAVPDEELWGLLDRLSQDQANEVVIISNRDRYTLEEWFGDYPIALSAEHGIWTKEPGSQWVQVEPVSGEWKNEIKPALEMFVVRTPGSFVEEKDFSLVWHYRTVDPELASVRAKELKDALLPLAASFDLEVAEGNNIIMIKKTGVDKGRAALRWLKQAEWDFILCAGDDWTDEDMFAVLPDSAYSLRVGLKVSRAKYNLDTPREARQLLAELVR